LALAVKGIIEIMKTISKVLIVTLFVAWSAVSLIEFSTKPSEAPTSIVSQMWVNYVVPYAIFFGILYWFLHASGLSEVRSYLKRSKEHMEFVEESLRQKANAEEKEAPDETANK
jgi:type III secretory pathway component EscU